MTALFLSKCIKFCLQFEKLYSFILQILVEEFEKLCSRCVKKLLPAPKLDLKRYIRKQCLLGIKKKILNVNDIQPYSIYIVNI